MDRLGGPRPVGVRAIVPESPMTYANDIERFAYEGRWIRRFKAESWIENEEKI